MGRDMKRFPRGWGSWPLNMAIDDGLGLPHRCGTLTHDNHGIAPHGAVRASIPEITDLNWRGDVTWTPGGTAIIRSEKGESTYSGLKEQK